MYKNIKTLEKILSTLFLSLCLPTFSLSQEIAPFTSDGCSAFPDGTFDQNELWLECCTAHDLAYWKGGTYMERMDADLELQQCVAKLGEDGVALLMLAGVRAGGSPFFPTTFRWGYGWEYPRGYSSLVDEELQQIKSVTSQSSNMPPPLN